MVGQPVRIGSLEARWQGLNPDLVLDEVVVADRQGQAAFSLARVEGVLSWQSLLLGRPILSLLAFERPVLHVRRDAQGKITVRIDDSTFEGVESLYDAVDWLTSGRSMGKVVTRLKRD